MEFFDISNNSLEGDLISDIGKMARLKVLNLATNGFSGELPNELSKLIYLEFLDLSNNKFVGKLPDKLSPNLTMFNVSYNDLTGHIPENLKQFPSSSFRPGNEKLNLPNNFSMPDNIPIKGKYHSSQGRLARPSFPTTAFSFSTDHIFSSESRSLSISGQSKFIAEITELGLCQGTLDTSSTSEILSLVDNLPTSSEITPCPDSPLTSFPRYMPNLCNNNSPNRLTGDLLFLDCSLSFTEAELADAPAEVLGTSSYGTLYKVTLDSGHVLTAKRLRFGIFERKMDFVRGARRIGSMRHPKINPLRACYFGPWEEVRILYADYIHGESLALHLYGLDYNSCLTDYGLHGLMTPAAIAEQIRNLGALGYCAPELATASRPVPSFQANVYAFGVILMEISTGKSAGDLISDSDSSNHPRVEFVVSISDISAFKLDSGLRSPRNGSCNGPTMDKVEEEVQSKRTQKLRVLKNLWSSNIGPTNLKHMGQKENEAKWSQKGEESIENKQGKKLITTSSHQKVDMVGQTPFLISYNVKGIDGVQDDRSEEKSNNRKTAKTIEERLDQALANNKWKAMRNSISVSSLTGHKSDHNPILTECYLKRKKRERRREKLYSFEQLRLEDEECEGLVKSFWYMGNKFSKKVARVG
ncbi:hypothetical protein RIF29_15650 [Crotalaria pallida]|uniref:Protein kinase domain-containing protein n=1 Tax=Crotalaria pallida TaxID=3830 RepID=A0AAN9IDR6_CROPI